jgi:hypothetical protein
MILFEPVRDASREGFIRTAVRKLQLHILANHHIPSVALLGINASTNAHVGPVASTAIAVSVRRPGLRIRTLGLGEQQPRRRNGAPKSLRLWAMRRFRWISNE